MLAVVTLLLYCTLLWVYHYRYTAEYSTVQYSRETSLLSCTIILLYIYSTYRYSVVYTEQHVLLYNTVYCIHTKHYSAGYYSVLR